MKHEAGFVAEDTVDGTVSSLRRYSALTPDERAALRPRARKCFHEEFDFSTTAKKVLESLEQLARSTPRYQPCP